MSLQNWLKTGSLKRKEVNDSSDSSPKIVALGTIQDEYPPPGPSTSEISSQELTEISSSNTCLVKCTVTNESKSSDSMKNSSKSSDSLDPTHFKHKLTDADKLVFLSSKTDTKPVKYYPQKGGRRYLPSWESQYTWLRYSESEDAAYCECCMTFSDNASLFAKKGFSDWKNAVGVKRSSLKGHEESDAHIYAAEAAKDFIAICQGSKPDIYSSLSKSYENRVAKNRAILISIIDIIVVLGQRNIALREHLETASRSLRYLSPKVQNELIQCCEVEIRERLIDNCKKSKFFAVCADETTDVSVKEQLSICVRYVDSDTNDIREDFLGFVEPGQVDAEHISKAILENLQNWGLNLVNLRGQGYDGASVMSGVVSGVQQRIKELLSNAPYVHCKSHNLNLVVTDSCKNVRQVRNLMASVGQMTWFLCASYKRKEILKSFTGDKDLLNELLEGVDCDGDNIDVSLLKKGGDLTVAKLCETRWTARVDAVSSLMAQYQSVHSAISKIETVSSADARTNAAGFRRLEDPEFIIAIKTDCNMVTAFDEANSLIKILGEKRNDEQFNQLFSRAEKIADRLEVDLRPKRRVGRQVHRENAALESDPTSHWRINLFFPFIDHVTSELQRRFPNDLKTQMMGYYLIPKHLHSLTPDIITTICDAFDADLSNKNDFMAEVERWRIRVDVHSAGECVSLKDSLKLADFDLYPNIHTVFKLLLVLPVTSVCCERSFSALRRLKTWERSTMTGERLKFETMKEREKKKKNRKCKTIEERKKEQEQKSSENVDESENVRNLKRVKKEEQKNIYYAICHQLYQIWYKITSSHLHDMESGYHWSANADTGFSYLWSPYADIRSPYADIGFEDLWSPYEDIKFGYLWSPYDDIKFGYLWSPYADIGFSYIWSPYADIEFGDLWSPYEDNIVFGDLWSPCADIGFGDLWSTNADIVFAYIWSPYADIGFGDLWSPYADIGFEDLWPPYADIKFGNLWSPYEDIKFGYLWSPYADIGFGYIWSPYADIEFGDLWSPYADNIGFWDLWSPYADIGFGDLWSPYADIGFGDLWSPYADIGFEDLWSPYADI
ncbi:unnamed protein product [Mytilus edulis]|uniref:TTF-type domain-containing protein n=1 Tax=Mytilus edulis TaxID=6550 RepID=A0A8S3SAZ7_MYTED|nr:unnamed protein product [Mytilus edulis]